MRSMREENMFSQPGDANYGVWLSVDVIAVTGDGLVVITRENEPHRGETTLPGGLVKADLRETIHDTATRVMREKAGLEVNSIRILTAVSDPERDERGHTVSIVVLADVSGDATTVAEIPAGMPFDHSGIAERALRSVHRDAFVVPEVAQVLFGEGILRDFAGKVSAIEGLLGLEPRSEAAIVKQLLRTPFLQPTGNFRRPPIGRPAEEYRVAV